MASDESQHVACKKRFTLCIMNARGSSYLAHAYLSLNIKWQRNWVLLHVGECSLLFIVKRSCNNRALIISVISTLKLTSILKRCIISQAPLYTVIVIKVYAGKNSKSFINSHVPLYFLDGGNGKHYHLVGDVTV